MKPPILVTRRLFPHHMEALRAAFSIADNATDVLMSPDTLRARAADREALLITGSDRIDEALLVGAPRLRVISTISVGHNHIDVDACTRHGVCVTNTPDVLTEATADLAWALMMAAARRVGESERWLRAGHWKGWSLDQFLGSDVHGSTLGILGMGRIGKAVAMRARGFGMRVLYHNRNRVSPEVETTCAASFVERARLFEQADHVILVVPYSTENHHCVGAPELSMMKPSATLTNIARGGIVDEDALVTALRTGQIAAAGLDVFEGEPAVRDSLRDLENVVLTPHIGSATRATRGAMADLAIANLIAAMQGQSPHNPVNQVALRA